MKKQQLFSAFAGIVAGSLLFTACKKEDGNPPPPPEKHAYVLVTMSNNDLTKPGYMTAFSELPSGDVSNIKDNSLQGMGMGGWRPWGNHILKMFNTAANEKGIERIAVGSDYNLSSNGFIKTNNSINGSGNFVIQDAGAGFYWDADEPMKIQQFDPASLQRTGSLDLSVLTKTDENIKFQATGQHFLAVKNGKLLADITYGTKTGAQSGMFDDYYDTIFVAVIDIATGNYEKTIKYPGTGGITYINDNYMYSMDEAGNLYIVCQGKTAIGGKSKIIRIKADETDFDTSWELNMDDIMTGGKFVTVFASNGKLITLVPTEALTGGQTGNINFSEIWEYHVVDIASRSLTKISGVPKVTNPGAAFGTISVDGKLLLRVNAPNENTNGYYELDAAFTHATPLFNVTEGGSVSGLYKVVLP